MKIEYSIDCNISIFKEMKIEDSTDCNISIFMY